jgi:hypothetical protein
MKPTSQEKTVFATHEFANMPFVLEATFPRAHGASALRVASGIWQDHHKNPYQCSHLDPESRVVVEAEEVQVCLTLSAACGIGNWYPGRSKKAQAVQQFPDVILGPTLELSSAS